MAASNGAPNNRTEDRALKALIVGAGIGGLAAAVGLRQQGHNVKVGHESELTKWRIEQRLLTRTDLRAICPGQRSRICITSGTKFQWPSAPIWTDSRGYWC